MVKYHKGVTPMTSTRGESKRRGYKTTHDHPLYARWLGMMERCYNPGHNRYPRYGARGIRVLERWHNFWNFVDDMFPSLPPERSKARKDRYTISRWDHARDYTLNNVRWELPATHYARKRQIKVAA